MSKKKKKNQSRKIQCSSQSQFKAEVRLSQCMIVKNEEKNIERALAWAKPIAFEQIVVDTGSTDKTVEIAEKMGAKVFHFEWIKDFSVAKNYALEQATGDWIAFLDADEYISSEDALKLMDVLKKVHQNHNIHNSVTMLSMPMIHLNDAGDALSVYEQKRVFRNIKQIHYSGRIHEQLTAYGNIKEIDFITLMHTGYSETEHREKNKTIRNIDLLREELKINPNDMMKKAYLADSLQSKLVLDDYSNKEEIAETEALFRDVIESKDYVAKFLRKKAYMYVIGELWEQKGNHEKQEECDLFCKKAYLEFPEDLDIGYRYAIRLNRNKEFQTAWEILKGYELQLTDGTGHIVGASAEVQADPSLIFGQLLLAAQGLGDLENTISYASVLLTSDKKQQNILSPYIRVLLQNNISEEDVLGLLGRIYDISSPSDLLLIARAAKDCGAIDFAKMIMTIARELMV